MPTKTKEISKNASGRSWSTGPYVRKPERDLWNQLYKEFTDEMIALRGIGGKFIFEKEEIDGLANNCAYRVIWLLREQDD